MIELLNIINDIIVKYAGVSNILTIIVTVLASIYITGKLNRKKLEKIKFEVEKKYSRSLFNKRVEIYPSLSAILSGYKKIITDKNNDEKNFSVFIEMLDKWNTKNSLFFSSATAHFSDMSRSYFRYLSKKPDNQNVSDSHEISETELSKDDWKDIYRLLGDFEITLRADIRMFNDKAPGNPDDVNTIIDSLEKKLKNLPEDFAPYRNS